MSGGEREFLIRAGELRTHVAENLTLDQAEVLLDGKGRGGKK